MDLILKNARVDDRERCDIGIAAGRIAAIAPRLEAEGETIDLDGRLVSAGFIETHLHLDKSCILDRCASERGDLAEAIGEAAKAKAAFTEEDVHARDVPWRNRSFRARPTCALILKSTPASDCTAWRAFCR
jgi:cytosine deaminase